MQLAFENNSSNLKRKTPVLKRRPAFFLLNKLNGCAPSCCCVRCFGRDGSPNYGLGCFPDCHSGCDRCGQYGCVCFGYFACCVNSADYANSVCRAHWCWMIPVSRPARMIDTLRERFRDRVNHNSRPDFGIRNHPAHHGRNYGSAIDNHLFDPNPVPGYPGRNDCREN